MMEGVVPREEVVTAEEGTAAAARACERLRRPKKPCKPLLAALNVGGAGDKPSFLGEGGATLAKRGDVGMRRNTGTLARLRAAMAL